MIPIALLAVLGNSTVASAAEDGAPTTAVSEKQPVHVNLSVGAPVPFVSGYVVGIEGMLGVEWIDRLEFRFKVRREFMDAFLADVDQYVLQSQLVYYGIRRDYRILHKGWTKKYGLLLGHALRSGDTSTREEGGGYKHYQRIHYATAGFIFKTTRWWRKSLGLMMSVSAIGGVSLHTYSTYAGNTTDSCCMLPEKDEFDFADTGFWELGFHIGLEL